MFWIKLDKKCTKLDQDIIFGTIYVPPSKSRFLNDDEFDFFQNEITHMCSKFEYVYLAGDINAQTSDLPDYTSAGYFLSRYFDFDDETILSLYFLLYCIFAIVLFLLSQLLLTENHI